MRKCFHSKSDIKYRHGGRLEALSANAAAEAGAQGYTAHNVVLDELMKRLVGRYYIITGNDLDQYLLVENIQPVEGVSDHEIDTILAEVT